LADQSYEKDAEVSELEPTIEMKIRHVTNQMQISKTTTTTTTK